MRTHTKAFVTALQGDTNLTVYLAEVPDKPAFPYVVVYPYTGQRMRSSLVALSDRVEQLMHVTSVGLSPDQAEAVAEAASNRVLDQVLTIAGRNVNPITFEADQPVRRDDAVDPHTFYAVTVYRITSVPG